MAQKEDIERLLAHNVALANTPAPQRSETPLYISETEEDITFQREAGLISIAEAEDLLRELAFDDPNISVEI